MLDVIETLQCIGGEVREVSGETRVYIDAHAHLTQYTKDRNKRECETLERHASEVWVCPMTRAVRLGGFDVSPGLADDILDALGIDDRSIQAKSSTKMLIGA